MKRSSLVLAAIVMALSLLAIPYADAAKVIKLHNLNKDDPFDNPTGAMATVFKSLMEAGTNGEITVQTFPNGQLGKDNEVVTQVKAGVIQSGIHSVGGFASIYPMIGVIDVPFAFPNISATYAVFDGPFGQKLAADIEAEDRPEGAGLRRLGRVLPLHELQAADQDPGGHEGAQDPHHGPRHPQGDRERARRPARGHPLGRGLHRAADRGRRRPDEPGAHHLVRQDRTRCRST